MKKENVFHFIASLAALLAFIGIIYAPVNAKSHKKVSHVRTHKVKKHHQKKTRKAVNNSHALAKYRVQKYRTVNNSTHNGHASLLNYIDYSDNYQLTNPQSFQIVGHYAYFMCTYYSNTGYVAKVNLNSFNGSRFTDVKVGPNFHTGHGQSLAYNLRNHSMWFVTKPAIHAQVKRLNMKTLKPNKTVNFKLSSTVKMGEQLAFDKAGRAYFDTYSYGGWAKKGTVKIYQGKIGRKIRFHLIMKGIRHNPGVPEQNLAYNQANNNLYFVSNGVIMRAPVSKLNHLKKRNVRTWRTGNSNEFEGLAFRNGIGYQMVNTPHRLMRISNSNF